MVELKRLKNWDNTLNGCIRCGYCYEHCPIYKTTRWETDAPRAKLTMLHGLLHGSLEPSNYVVGKLFECFNCKRCENACSSGVPITEIFAGARADLLDAGLDAEGTTSVTDHERCALCLNCVRMCKHEARCFSDGKIVTDRTKCLSCGSCLDVCSGRAILIRKGFGTNPDEQLVDISRFLADSSDNAPRVVVFACNWSNYPGFQTASHTGQQDGQDRLELVTACSGRLRNSLILEALERGAEGVIVLRCPEDECEHDGSRRARARIENLQSWLGEIGVDPRRVKTEIVAKDDPKAHRKLVSDFIEEICSIGSPGEGGGK